MTVESDVAIVGAGVVGLAIADRLAQEGMSVTLLDAGEPGREASWAGSGALSLIMPDLAPPAMRPLAAYSEKLWRTFAADLEAHTSMTIEYLPSGVIRLVLRGADDSGVRRTVDWLKAHDVEIEPLDATALRAVAPLVTDQVALSLLQRSVCQVRPPRLLHALRASVASRNVNVLTHERVLGVLRSGHRVVGVRTENRTVHAAEVVLAAGSWAGEFARRSLNLHMPVIPVRGQVALLEGPAVRNSPLILNSDGAYIIPRADGRILAGSTFEPVGFDRRVTAGGIHSILEGVFRFAPALREARLATTWAGLRPQSPDKLPYLGRMPGLDGMSFACGHFRDGILLSAVTAQVIADVIHGRDPAIDISAFAVDRFAGDADDARATSAQSEANDAGHP